MTFQYQFRMLKSVRNSFVAATFELGMLAGVAEAAPIAPGSMPFEAIQSPIEPAVVVVHHRRPVVRHHRRRVCWWRHGRRVCHWR